MKSTLIISYDGAWPCLCMGTLSVDKFGQKYDMQNILQSGGSIRRSEDWDMWSEQGEWSLDEAKIPEDLKQDIPEILQWVQDNVSQGCCGGCI